MDSKLKFLSNNVNGLKSSKKRIKMFEYFRDKVCNNGATFLQETNSSEDALNKWQDDLQGRIFFSHETMNSCGAIIDFHGKKKN